MKLCKKCLCEKDELEFRIRKLYHRKNRLWMDSQCKECRSKYRRKWYIEHRQQEIDSATKYRNLRQRFVYELLTHKQCVLCGEKDRIVLDFHHKNKEDKIDSVARLAAFNTTKEDVWKESIVREMEKCDVLCANCHKRETAKQQRWIVRNVPAQ